MQEPAIVRREREREAEIAKLRTRQAHMAQRIERITYSLVKEISNAQVCLPLVLLVLAYIYASTHTNNHKHKHDTGPTHRAHNVLDREGDQQRRHKHKHKHKHKHHT